MWWNLWSILIFFKLTKNHDFSEILWKISNLFEIPGQISILDIFYRKISMFVKIFETVDFGKNFDKNTDFGQNFRKC